MANQPEGFSDDSLDHILSYAGHDANFPGGGFPAAVFQLGKVGFPEPGEASGKRFREEVEGEASGKTPFHGQSMPGTVSVVQHSPAARPRVRARRGQATDPHSIAERLRRERITERIKALQELMPNCNKTDRAVMLDEVVDYVKFLRLQVKVLSMSRLGGADAVAQLVADIPVPSEGEDGNGGSRQQIWEKWSTNDTERQVAKLMEEDVGAAMQLLQSKALCIMPISLANAIYQRCPPEALTHVKPEPNAPSQA